MRRVILKDTILNLVLRKLYLKWRIELNFKRMMLALVAGLIIFAACSSPAVTGIKVHIQNGEYQEAIHLADSVIAGAEAANPEVWYWQGRAYSSIKVWDKAAVCFVEAFELDPTYASNLSNYWPAFYNTAIGYYDEGNVTEAIDMLKAGKAIVPTRPEFDQMLGTFALNDENYEEAIDYFESSVIVGLEQIDYLRTQIDGSIDPAATEILNEDLDRSVQSVVLASYNSGSILKNLYMNSEDETEALAYREEAISVLDTAIETDPSNADLMTLLAEFYILSQEYDAALAIYDDALVAIDTGVEEGWIAEEDAADMKAGVLLTRGFTFIEMDRFDEGIAALEECRIQMGDTYQVLELIAHANFTMENYDRAIETLEEIVNNDGFSADEYAKAWSNMYANYTRLSRDGDALTAIKTAVEYVQDNPVYYESLANAYARLGRNNEAMQAMEKAESLR